MAAQRLFHSLGQGVGLTNWQIGIHLDRDVAINAMSDPACAHVAHGTDASYYMRRRVLDLSKNLWLNAVDQASPNGNCCIFDDQEYAPPEYLGAALVEHAFADEILNVRSG